MYICTHVRMWQKPLTFHRCTHLCMHIYVHLMIQTRTYRHHLTCNHYNGLGHTRHTVYCVMWVVHDKRNHATHQDGLDGAIQGLHSQWSLLDAVLQNILAEKDTHTHTQQYMPIVTIWLWGAANGWMDGWVDGWVNTASRMSKVIYHQTMMKMKVLIRLRT